MYMDVKYIKDTGILMTMIYMYERTLEEDRCCPTLGSHEVYLKVFAYVST